MTTDLENTLARELGEVADRIDVPPLPSLTEADASGGSRRTRAWQPLLVAAAVLLVIGLVALVQRQQGGDAPEPAPSPTPTPTEISGAVPSIPFVLDGRLYVDGTEVPGEWWSVESRGETWLGQQADGSWWWGGPGIDGNSIEGEMEAPPVLSPSGGFVAFVDLTGSTAHVTGFDTAPAGEGFGQAPTDLPAVEDGVPIRVRAVTDEGDVVVQGTSTSLMWRTQVRDQPVVDLGDTAPDQVVLQGTAAGLVVVDGSDGATDATETAPYLASLSPEGTLAREADLPTYDDLVVSPGGTWVVRSPAGTLGGEVTGVDRLVAQPVGQAEDEVELEAPKGLALANGTWTWEDEQNLVAVVLAANGEAGLARCNVLVGACRTIDVPPPAPAGTDEPAPVDGTVEGALDAVVRAVTADDRRLLVDQGVIDSSSWDQLRSFAAGGGGRGESCRDNGEGTRDCEIRFDADPAAPYYAILEPAENAYGWRISYVGLGGA